MATGTPITGATIGDLATAIANAIGTTATSSTGGTSSSVVKLPYSNLDELDKEIEKLKNRNELEEKAIFNYQKRNLLKEEEREIEEKLANLKKEYVTASEERQAEIQKEILELSKEQIQVQQKINQTSGFKAMAQDVSKAKDTVVGFYKAIRDFVEPWAKADDAASKFTKTLGGTKAAMDRLRKDTLDSVATGIGVKFNMSTEELLKAQQDYLKGIGRNINIDDISRESMAAISRISQDAGVDGLGFAAQLENFGVSIDKTGDHMGKMFADASKSGISFQKYSDNVVKNIKLAQNYTFKNGIKGLESMAKKATALKMDMQQVANLADKVSTVEGALETSANLQVLGGPFAAMADPMGMLYEGLNDMEGLQDRILKMIGGLGSFNKETGEVQVSAFNKQRIKAAAAAMGMDYSAVMESVNAQAKRGEIERQINSSTVASKFDKDMKELIMNTGVIKDGKVGVNVNGKFKTLDEIKEGDREILKQQTQTQSEDIKQIAMDLRSIVDQEQGIKKQKDAIQAEIASPIGQILKYIMGIFDYAGIAITILGAISAAQAIGNIGSGVSDIFDMFRGGRGGIFRRGLGRAGKRGLIKAFGRKGATKILGRGAASTVGKGAVSTVGRGIAGGVASAGASGAASTAGGLGSKLLAAGAKGGGIGAVAGIAGTVGDYYTDKAVAEGKMEVGGTGHHLAKAGSKALQWGGTGMAVGSIFGPVGALVGGAIGAIGGAIAGAVSASKAKNKKVVDTILAEKGIQLKGDYGNGKLKDIEKALNSGEMSDSLRRKLIANDDMAVVKEIEKKKAEKDKIKAEKNKNKMNIRLANIYVSTARFGGKGMGIFAESAFGKVKLKAIKEKGYNPSVDTLNKQQSAGHNPSTGYNVNINGTLKLSSDNGESIDIISELRHNPQLLRSLAELISSELSYQEMGRFPSQL